MTIFDDSFWLQYKMSADKALRMIFWLFIFYYYYYYLFEVESEWNIIRELNALSWPPWVPHWLRLPPSVFIFLVC